MVRSQRNSDDGQTQPDLNWSRAGRDRMHTDSEQTGSGRDQGAADRDLLPADRDQSAGDRDVAQGVDREGYDSGREVRVRATQARRDSSTQRLDQASARDATAHQRDLSALARDQAAEARDLEDDQRDAEIASLDTSRRRAVGRSSRRSARDRQRAASDRARSATHRIQAGADRDRAARDRQLAADDRASAAADRAHATAEREADEVDMLTGARRRAPGLADVQREIERANRGNGQLIAVYVDVDGLKATNDSRGHHAGDAMLKHIVGVLRANLRSYESVVRLGGDEFVCTISSTTIQGVRKRFDQIIAELALTPDDGSISVGFAELAPRDSVMDLIDRADRELIASRDTRSHARSART